MKCEDLILFIFQNDISSIYFSESEVRPIITRDGVYYGHYCYVAVILTNGKFKYFTLSGIDFLTYYNHNLHVNRIAKESSNVNWKLDGF